MGERNSGTNYLEQLLLGNGLINSVGGMAPDYIRAIARLTPWREAVIDRWFGDTKVWKHAYLDSQAKEIVSDQKVIALSKHPLAWSLSMLRRPYHLSENGRARGEDGTSETWHELMGRVWPTQRRERIAPDTGFELWAAKYQSYLDAPDALVIRYEQLLSDSQAVLESIVEHLELADCSIEDLESVEGSTKADSRTSDDIRDYYLSEKWRDKLPSDYLSFVPESLVSVAKRLGYEDL